ncbi:MAG: YidC/Oxa1 family membrane protein insertase [Actinomycetota bacterium]|nr:YidC/Oxa1 family membrane protein insertase [Actinomycetota bacterium]
MGFFEIFAGALAGFYALIPSLGLAIILLTVAVRVLLLPLSIKQTRSMREMQRIQPEVKRIQAKYKGNRQKMNEEMMALYKEHNVNPFGGCLPLVMQFPVLIGLFYVIRTPLRYMGFSEKTGEALNVSGIMETIQTSSLAEALRTAALEVHQFLGIRLDCSSSAALSRADPSGVGEICGTGVVSALPYLVLVALMGLTTWYQQKQMQATRGAGDNPQAQQMQLFMRIMPIMLMFFAFSFPSGVVLYWLTTNVWTIAQQRIVLRAVPPEEQADAKAAPAGDGKGSGKASAGDGKTSGKPAKGGLPAQSKADGGNGRAAERAPKPHPSSKKKKRR